MLKKKKKNRPPTGKIDTMLVNGTQMRCVNMRLFNDENGVGKLDVYTKEPAEALHFDRSDMEIKTTDNKKLVLSVRFLSAEKEKKLYHYLFEVDHYNEFFA